jgi:hypothetical protein
MDDTQPPSQELRLIEVTSQQVPKRASGKKLAPSASTIRIAATAKRQADALRLRLAKAAAYSTTIPTELPTEYLWEDPPCKRTA